MRALEQTSLQGPQDTRYITEAPVPTPGQDELLIRVTAAGVNFADISRACGTFAGGPRPPYLAGFEAAGEVLTGPRAGQHVVGVGYGAFAEYMVLPAAAAMPVPEGWTDEQALGLVVNWPTALAALKLGRLAAGETVLIHAAAGATGQAAVTLAKHKGATVIATASPAKHETPKALGADQVLDSRAMDLAELAGTVDLVLDSAAFHSSLAAAKRVTGRVVVFGVAGGEASLTNWDLVYKHQVQVIGFNLGALIESAPQLFGQLMGELSELIAAGVVTPARPTTYDLADGARALTDLAARATIGKLALRP
jgi:NADPH2:quinone reductase